jgi:ubiquitin-like 1-activating enzyme E1 B
VEIPLKPKPPVQPSPEPAVAIDGTSATGKRKREGEGVDDLEAANEHNAKRLASTSIPDTESNEPIVLDDDEDGAIMID